MVQTSLFGNGGNGGNGGNDGNDGIHGIDGIDDPVHSSVSEGLSVPLTGVFGGPLNPRATAAVLATSHPSSLHPLSNADDVSHLLGSAKMGEYFQGLAGFAQRMLNDLDHPDAAVIWSDGACSGNGVDPNAAGGWGFVLARKNPQAQDGQPMLHAQCGGERPTTNNRMELMAAISALLALPEGRSPIMLVTDSQYVIKGSTEWRAGWMRRGMKNSAGDPVANPDLWKRLWAVVDARRVKFQWVKGHSGHAANELADALSVKGSKEAARSGR